MAIKIVIFVILAILKIVTSSILNVNVTQANKIFHGRYTRNVQNPELLVPRHVHHDGNFKSFMLPSFYSCDEINERKKRSSLSDSSEDKVHLVLPFNGKEHHIDLTPYHDFISPDLVIEIRGKRSPANREGVRFKRASDEQCHYRGSVRGDRNSRAALSLCDGVAGIILLNNERYFIEPLEESIPGSHGEHVHMIYRRQAHHENDKLHKFCGTTENWEAAWTKQLVERERRLTETGDLDKLKRGNMAYFLKSIPRYIELGLFADRKFIDYWEHRDMETYVLIMVNMVQDLYHDGTVGNLINIMLTRITYLENEEEEPNLRITPDAESTLDSFSSWANRIRPSPGHPNHYDVAVLVSRHNLCSRDAGCALMGLAYVGTACTPAKASAVVEDSGLLMGIVMTHEIGHSLGCSHDTPDMSGCPSEDTDGSYFIMAPYAFMYTLRWSPCSREYISNFFNTGLGECLSDNPRNQSHYGFPNILLGSMYNRDFQCSQKHPQASACPAAMYSVCDQIWCRIDNMCLTDGSPPAEGTECGKNNWCIQKECVPMGTRPKAVHGNWGKWGRYSECSRTCGGGVEISERQCDDPPPSNGGKYCIGTRRRLKTCNMQNCPILNTVPYRAYQCSQYDNKDLLGPGKHIWKPYMPDNIEPCTLTCINENGAYLKIGPAADGTPCTPGRYDMCVSGECILVGCDWVFLSRAVEDRCGVCNGDGSRCYNVEGDYTHSRSFGYTKVVAIPKQARNIIIWEKAPTNNLLAVKYVHNSSYCMNGNFNISHVGEFTCAGTTLIYKEPRIRQEELFIKGPIHEDIEIQALFLHERNPGIHYSYVLMKDQPSNYHPHYLWEFLTWSNCNVRCGGGTKTSLPDCIEQIHGLVSDSYCKFMPRPDPKVLICNEEPCPIRWKVGVWSACSACNGRKGNKTRKVECIKMSANANDDIVLETYKECAEEPEPAKVMECIGTRPCRQCHHKSKSTEKRQDNDPTSDEFGLDNSDNIDRSINMGLARYLKRAEDEDVNNENEHSEGNEKAENELKKILEKLLSDPKEKRMCGEGKYVVEVEAKVTEETPESVTSKEESNSNVIEAESNVNTQDAQSKLEASDEEDGPISMIHARQNKKSIHSKGDTTKKPLPTIKPGTIIKDVYVPDNALLIEAPIKKDYYNSNVSDLVFQEMGNLGNFQLDTTHQKIFRGKEAQDLLNEMAYGNHTKSQEDNNTE